MCFSTIFLSSSVVTDVWSVDLTPGEITPLPEGTNFFQLSFLETWRKGSYKEGRLVNKSTQLEAQQWLLRYGRFDTFRGVPIYSHIELPFLSIDAQNGFNDQAPVRGLGDISVAVGFWPYADFKNHKYWAFGGYLVFPTGNYKSNNLYNPGSNRYSATLQTAYQANLAPNLIWISAIDSMFFTKNNEFGPQNLAFEQKPFITVQTGFRFLLNKTLAFSASLIKTEGGAYRINEYEWSKPNDIRRYQLGIYQFFRKTALLCNMVEILVPNTVCTKNIAGMLDGHVFSNS